MSQDVEVAQHLKELRAKHSIKVKEETKKMKSMKY